MVSSFFSSSHGAGNLVVLLYLFEEKFFYPNIQLDWTNDLWIGQASMWHVQGVGGSQRFLLPAGWYFLRKNLPPCHSSKGGGKRGFVSTLAPPPSKWGVSWASGAPLWLSSLEFHHAQHPHCRLQLGFLISSCTLQALPPLLPIDRGYL